MAKRCTLKADKLRQSGLSKQAASAASSSSPDVDELRRAKKEAKKIAEEARRATEELRKEREKPAGQKAQDTPKA